MKRMFGPMSALALLPICHMALIDEIRAASADEGSAGGSGGKGKGKAGAKVGANAVKPKADTPKGDAADAVVDLPNPLSAKDDDKAPETPAEVEKVMAAEPVQVGGFVIEDNIPMPDSRGGGGKAKYPWEVLKVGQSFYIPDGKIKTAYTMASHAGKKHKKTFSCRAVEGGVRIWRTA